MKFIGFYDYTVILTYLSLMSSVIGMTRAIHADYKTAVFCLALSGIFDAFDGRVARTKKNRTDDEKAFGIQLDSLCDVVCFGVFPAVYLYFNGVNSVFGVALLVFYVLFIMLSGRIYKGLLLYTGEKVNLKNVIGILKNKN